MSHAGAVARPSCVVAVEAGSRVRTIPDAEELRGLAPPSEEAWCLSENSSGASRCIPLWPLPFRVGRDPRAQFVVPSHTVSKLHAEVYSRGSQIRIRDLGSTNGTFLDFKRIRDAALREGATLHFADFECRLRKNCAHSGKARGNTIVLPPRFALGRAYIQQLLSDEAVEPVFQPIVSLSGGGGGAYEALARGRHPNLPEKPDELFWLAKSTGKETELSRLCRRLAVDRCAASDRVKVLFLNTHPSELHDPNLVSSLGALRRRIPRIHVFLEIHESALADTRRLRQLRGGMRKLGIGLAFDDFGAGQARMLELAEVPPDYLKFDSRFVRGIDHGPASKVRLLSSFLDAARDLRIKCVAEGVETEAEALACGKLGFTHAQGYLFGRPRRLTEPGFDRTSLEARTDETS